MGNTDSGVQHYARLLANNLKKSASNLQLQLLVSSNKGENRVKRIIGENLQLPKYLKKNRADIYHSPSYVLPFQIKTPSVLTIHDVITFDYPKLCQWESVLYFRTVLPRSVKQAKKIIAVSHTVKQDIIRRFKVDEAKIAVIYHGVAPEFKPTPNRNKMLERHGIPQKYILFIGNIEPKKNLERLLRAFSQLVKKYNIPHKLVLAGKKGWKYASLFKEVKHQGLSHKVIFTGYFPAKELPVLYSNADLFMFPSLYEGFGIPPLEAMACGTPVVVSNKGALPEITGGLCPQVDPYNEDDIAVKMYRLLTDPKLRQQTIQNSKEWAKQFTWEKTAHQTLQVYQEVYNTNK